jgi:hypothetical protein
LFLQPENVLVTEGFKPSEVLLKIGDFGVAKVVESSVRLQMETQSISKVDMSTGEGNE